MTDSTNSKNTVVSSTTPKSRTPAMLKEAFEVLGAEYAMYYYANVRTKNAKGVTIPSQQRWVKYVELYYKYPVPSYKIKQSRLLRISLYNLPKIYKNRLSVEVKIWNRRENN